MTIQFYENENLELPELRVFLNCGGDNIPAKCFCGCNSTRGFTLQEQKMNYLKKYEYRFFSNPTHLKRFKILNKK